MKLVLSTITVFVLFVFISCSENSVQQELVETRIEVGVFSGNGASPVCILETLEALKLDSGISPRAISSQEIMAGELDHLDVLIFPGGSGSQQLNNLGNLGADKVRDFGKQEGNGLVGICAGGYILASTVNYPNLDIIPLTHIREHYNRGRGLISFSQNEAGDKLFPENKGLDNVYFQYYDGPIYNITDTSSVEVLATINTDIATKKDDPSGVTEGKPALLSYNYGQGKVLVSIGHPEATHGMRWLVPRMARLAINAELISYNPEVVKPEAYLEELLFFPEISKLEKKLFWQLSDADPQAIISAIDQLKELHSRPSIRWTIGLLRHQNAAIRIRAAEYLVYTEYTYALYDLQQAILNEKNIETKEKLESCYQKLKSYNVFSF